MTCGRHHVLCFMQGASLEINSTVQMATMCRVSELRASEILDDLCEDMSNYGLAKPAAPEPNDSADEAQAEEEWAWVLKGADSYSSYEKLTGEPAKQMSKRLKNYCYGVVERSEDFLAKYLASDSTHHEGVQPC